MVTQDDRRQIEQDDDDDQYQRRDVDHRLRSFHIGGLETDVINMKSQVHEFSIEVEKRPGTVYGERRRKFHDSCQHERRHFSSRSGHRQNQSGQNAR